MKKQSPPWIFPTVKVLVSSLYYLLLVVLIVFTGMVILKFFGLPSGTISPEGLSTTPSERPGYVSVDVVWQPFDVRLRSSSGEPPVFVTPQKQTGQLQVPIGSVLGLLMVGIRLVGLVTATWTFLLLRTIFRTVRLESPFDPSIARRINLMGLLFLGQTALESALKLLLWSQSDRYLRQLRADFGYQPTIDVALNGPLLLGLILLALAQVYRRGIELQAENELTV